MEVEISNYICKHRMTKKFAVVFFALMVSTEIHISMVSYFTSLIYMNFFLLIEDNQHMCMVYILKDICIGRTTRIPIIF